MKNTFFSALTLLSILGCNDSESKIDKSLKDYFEQSAKDPESYEPIETKVIDTIYVSDLAKLKVLSIESEIEDLKYEMEEIKIKKKYASSKTLDSIYNEMIKNTESRISLVTTDLDKYKLRSNNDSIYAYIVNHKFRAKNGFGALDLSTSVFAIDKDYKVISHNKTESKLTVDLVESLN